MKAQENSALADVASSTKGTGSKTTWTALIGLFSCGLLAALALAGAPAVLTGCGSSSCTAGNERCQCLSNNTCNAGLVCASHICVAATGVTTPTGGTTTTPTGGTTTTPTGGTTATSGPLGISCCTGSSTCFCYPDKSCDSDERPVTACPALGNCCTLDDVPDFCFCWSLTCSYTTTAGLGTATKVSGCTIK